MSLAIPESVKFGSQFIHPVLMWVLLATAIYALYLGLKIRQTRNGEGETKKELIQGRYNVRHYQIGSISLAFIPIPIYLGIIGSLLAGLATGVGGLPILFISEVSERVQGILLGFGAGVMLAATSFSLLLPSIEAASNRGSTVNAANIVVAGTLLGGIFLWFTHRYFPYERYIKKPKGSNSQNLKVIWLFVIAIAIHNFPEGLAVGVGFGEGDLGNVLHHRLPQTIPTIPADKYLLKEDCMLDANQI